ncbi:hydroxyectoine utilization dehydratase EutB [Rhodoligotrophos appendicifer]|uniref:hydroxyectoine utilization dehydratase EutB n=1 Tax=Rhodoligotrophos appendicifer TaxID=987056 RepID=UPI00117CB1AA|nr:hydroxyectoine utilization dehydratase EutB [Rhodoligotrophos appendicifer]
MTVTLEEIEAAHSRIAGKIEQTSIVASASLTDSEGSPVHLKLEHRQVTGSFKLRGATNAITLLTPEERRRGVVTMSTGNHGKALAFAACREGIRTIICMSSMVPSNKVEAIRSTGAEVRIIGASQDEAEDEVYRLVEAEGVRLISPFDDAAVIAGQGTIGLEIAHAIPRSPLVLVPLSGGGLAAGTAIALKASDPSARVVGVSMERGAAMKASLDAGKPVRVEELPSLADALGGGIGLGNRLTFQLCKDLLDDVMLVTEDEIAGAISHIYRVEREVVEGAGAVGVAALLSGKVKPDGPVVAVLSGRNIDMASHNRIVGLHRTPTEGPPRLVYPL